MPQLDIAYFLIQVINLLILLSTIYLFISLYFFQNTIMFLKFMIKKQKYIINNVIYKSYISQLIHIITNIEIYIIIIRNINKIQLKVEMYNSLLKLYIVKNIYKHLINYNNLFFSYYYKITIK